MYAIRSYYDIANNQTLIVFPNPASTQFSIVKNNPLAEVIVCNKLGQIVLRTTKHIVDVTALPTGVYIVSCENKHSKVSILNRK